MIEIVRCENCGNADLPFDSISVTVTLNKHVKPCQHCCHTRTETQDYFFCSRNCFLDYNAKVLLGEKSYVWREPNVTPIS